MTLSELTFDEEAPTRTEGGGGDTEYGKYGLKRIGGRRKQTRGGGKKYVRRHQRQTRRNRRYRR